jgi:hypothetical protein
MAVIEIRDSDYRTNARPWTFFFSFFLVKPHLGIKTLPPHLPLTFARTSTIDTPHCPLDLVVWIAAIIRRLTRFRCILCGEGEEKARTVWVDTT